MSKLATPYVDSARKNYSPCFSGRDRRMPFPGPCRESGTLGLIRQDRGVQNESAADTTPARKRHRAGIVPQVLKQLLYHEAHAALAFHSPASTQERRWRG